MPSRSERDLCGSQSDGEFFNAPQHFILAEYWAGNSFVTVKHQDPNFFAFLNRLRMANNASMAWILVADSVAGSIIILSLTGILLWPVCMGAVYLLFHYWVVGSLLAFGLTGYP